MSLAEIKIWDKVQSSIDKIDTQLFQLYHMKINTKGGYEDNIADKKLKIKLNRLFEAQFINDDCWSYSKKNIIEVRNILIQELETKKNKLEKGISFFEEHFKKLKTSDKNMKLRIPLTSRDQRKVIIKLYQVLSKEISPILISCKLEEFLSVFDYQSDLLNFISAINNKKILWEGSEREFVALFRELSKRKIIVEDFFIKHKGNLTLSILFEKWNDDKSKHVKFDPAQIRKAAHQPLSAKTKKTIDEIFLTLPIKK